MLKSLPGLLLFGIILFSIKAYRHGHPLRHARAVAETYGHELHQEASQLLRDARTSATGDRILPVSEVPRHIAILDARVVRVSPGTGMVIVEVRSSSLHEGIVLVDDPTSFSASALPTGHRQLSQSIWEYSD